MPSPARCLLSAALPVAAVLAAGSDDVELYIGAGSFWELQATLNSFEEDVLGRSTAGLTGIAGYAGGTDNGSPVCYTDYSGKGHAEVVQVTLPRDRVGEFLNAAWRGIFLGGDRVYVGSQGAKYRALVGVPGGLEGAEELVRVIDSVQREPKMELAAGRGSDGDTLEQGLLLIYDSDVFPFHQAEIYQQFKRPWRTWQVRSDSDMTDQLKASGRLKETGCPHEWVVAVVQPVVLGMFALLASCGFCCCFRHMCRQRMKMKMVRPAEAGNQFSVRIVNPPWQLQSI
mmetsp:Transcript_59731/g.153833  ORF Transcript_59731/g.153833 Transcript_59731/m.153833 type:complete len:285 (-) Transcript_59731:155-1009(-)